MVQWHRRTTYAVLENMVLKLTDDSKCSVANALVWAVTAKNALHNNLGYSPNQLVFDKNPNLPSVLTAKPPALRSCTHSQLLAEHLNALHAARTAFIASEASRKIKLALQKQTRDTSSTSFHLGAQVYYKRNDGKAWHGPGVIAGIDGKIVLVRHGGSVLRVSPVHLLPVRDADKQRAEDTLSHSGQDGLPQSGKVSENLSCDKGAQTDVLVTIDDVINDEDSDLHIPKDPLSGSGSARDGISSNSVAPSAHDEMCATESDIFYGDAPSHVVVDDYMNESEHVISKINREQTDFVQEESIACATSSTPFPSSPAHSPNQRDVFSHHTDFIHSLDTHDDEFAVQASSTNRTPAFLSECNTDNHPSDHPSGKTESTLIPATHEKCKEDSHSSSASM